MLTTKTKQAYVCLDRKTQKFTGEQTEICPLDGWVSLGKISCINRRGYPVAGTAPRQRRLLEDLLQTSRDLFLILDSPFESEPKLIAHPEREQVLNQFFAEIVLLPVWLKTDCLH